MSSLRCLLLALLFWFEDCFLLTVLIVIVVRFYKVFISYLEDAFERSSNKPHVKSLIQNQFLGTSEYVTVCKQCGLISRNASSFYEIELSVKVLSFHFSFFIFFLSLGSFSSFFAKFIKTLIQCDSITRVKLRWNGLSKVTLQKKNSLKPISNITFYFCTHSVVIEFLTKQWDLFLFVWLFLIYRYFCMNCKTKRDAIRYISLKSLPPVRVLHIHKYFSLSLSLFSHFLHIIYFLFCLQVLNFQILRLYYDTTTGTKKKRTSEMYFPVSINMRPFISRHHATSKSPAEVNPLQTDQTNLSSQSTNDQKNESDEYTYDLNGLLLHIGPSAYGGLYHSLSSIRILFWIEF
jgi:hypothetical protein